MLQESIFEIRTDTGGDYEGTSGPVDGFLMQLRFDRTPFGGSDTGVLDTGCDFKLELVNSGVVVADYDNAGGSSWTRVPRVLTFDTGGGEVGDTYPVTAHDRLKLTVTQSEGTAGAKTARFRVVTG